VTTIGQVRKAPSSYKEVVVGDIDSALAVLFAAVGLLLLIASANVANLLMMRSEARRSEFVVRAALGASRARLIRQLVFESLVVAMAAGALALALSRWSLQTVTLLVPDGLPRLTSIRIDGTVVMFTIGVAFLTAALSGLAPALAASRLDLVDALRGGGRGAIGPARHRGRRALVIAQVALAVTVVAAAGPADQFMITAGRLAVRTRAGASLTATAVGESVRAVDPTVRVLRVSPYGEYLQKPLAWPRFNALLLGVFAVAALLLSSVGLYGVMAASVRQRSSEVGVRVALGATATDVRRLVLGEALQLTVAGASIGLVLAFGTTPSWKACSSRRTRSSPRHC
jgi:hypothetical protein